MKVVYNKIEKLNKLKKPQDDKGTEPAMSF